MSLTDFAAKTTTCKIELVGGSKVELTFRPFTLADLAWLQEEFSTEEKSLDLQNLKVIPVCKVIWNQLSNESKDFFSDISYEKFNDETEEVEIVKLMGYKKLVHAIDHDNMLIAFLAYYKVQNITSFIPDEKKKKMKKAA